MKIKELILKIEKEIPHLFDGNTSFPYSYPDRKIAGGDIFPKNIKDFVSMSKAILPTPDQYEMLITTENKFRSLRDEMYFYLRMMGSGKYSPPKQADHERAQRTCTTVKNVYLDNLSPLFVGNDLPLSPIHFESVISKHTYSYVTKQLSMLPYQVAKYLKENETEILDLITKSLKKLEDQRGNDIDRKAENTYNRIKDFFAFNYDENVFDSTGANSSPAYSNKTESNGPIFKIYYGPPGTSKTTKAKKDYTGDEYEIVQIHPSFGYEDLIEGIKPVTFFDGTIKYEVVEGPVRVMARKASGDPLELLCKIEYADKAEFATIHLPLGTCRRYDLKLICLEMRQSNGSAPASYTEDIVCSNDRITISSKSEYFKVLQPNFNNFCRIRAVGISESKLSANPYRWGNHKSTFTLILDEINRGHVAAMLGELVFAISETASDEPKAVKLQYSQQLFLWPNNLSLIGTMNSADTSTDKIDQAIKRRFEFISVPPLEGSDLDDSTEIKIESLGKLTMGEYFKNKGIAKEFFPGELIKTLNDTLRDEMKDSTYNLEEKLIGHSYFIKYARKLAENLSAPDVIHPEMIPIIKFGEIYAKEIRPALLSVLNNNRDVLRKLEVKLQSLGSYNSTLIHIEKEANKKAA